VLNIFVVKIFDLVKGSGILVITLVRVHLNQVIVGILSCSRRLILLLRVTVNGERLSLSCGDSLGCCLLETLLMLFLVLNGGAVHDFSCSVIDYALDVRCCSVLPSTSLFLDIRGEMGLIVCLNFVNVLDIVHLEHMGNLLQSLVNVVVDTIGFGRDGRHVVLSDVLRELGS